MSTGVACLDKGRGVKVEEDGAGAELDETIGAEDEDEYVSGGKEVGVVEVGVPEPDPSAAGEVTTGTVSPKDDQGSEPMDRDGGGGESDA